MYVDNRNSGGGGGSGDVVGPASSVDSTIPLFDSTTGKLLKTSAWKITNSGATLESPIITNPSGEAILQRWGGVMTSGGQAGGGLTDAILGMTRDVAGPSTSKITDNWGLTYNRNNVAGAPRYGWNFETVYDTSAIGTGVESELYLEHRVENGSGGPAAGSVVGGRILQWNVTLPDSFAVNPANAAAYNTSSGKFPGSVAAIGVLNSLNLSAYDSAGTNRAALNWATSSASAGMSLVSNTGYTFMRFTDWGSRTNNDENSIVGLVAAAFNLKTGTTGFGAGAGGQFKHEGLNLSLTNNSAGFISLTSNTASFIETVRITSGQRVFMGYNGSGITDSGQTLQVKGNALFTGTGDTEVRIVGGNGPVLKFVSTQFSSGVDIQPDITKFIVRVNNNLPLDFLTAGSSRMEVHSDVYCKVPLKLNNAYVTGASNAAVLAALSGTITLKDSSGTTYYIPASTARP